MRRIAVFAVFLGCLTFGSQMARAQEQTPAFDLPRIITIDDVEDVSVDFDSSFSAIDNAYLSDTLKLNYQIGLLEKLVARQGELQKISESYQAMGVAFEGPPPARGICAQLPVNAPCLKHYPDLYGALAHDRKAYYDDLAAKALAANPNYVSPEDTGEAEEVRKKAEAKRQAREAEKERHTRYQWTEITCRGDDCHGVLIQPRKEGYRTTVREGTRLSDGTLVQNVSRHGIRIVIAGENISVRPAVAEEVETEQDQAANPIADALSGLNTPNGQNFASGPDAMSGSKAAAASVLANAQAQSTNPGTVQVAPNNSTAGAPSGVAAGQTMGEPALGPSGLF